MTIVLADLGGTNLRLSKDDGVTIAKFKLTDYTSFENVLLEFTPDISALYLASAITPLGGIIEDKRFSKDAHWRIDLNALGFKTYVLNDLEAAAYGLGNLPKDQAQTLVEATQAQRLFVNPPKLLIGIGTGIGHAFLFEDDAGHKFVQRTHGGHVPAFGVTEEQNSLIARLREKRSVTGRDLIMENIIGGKGLMALCDDIGQDNATRLFWEFLGLYTNMVVSLTGAYGGVYLSGGTIDLLVEEDKADIESFKNFFLRPMVDSVNESLSSTPIYYCKDLNLPVLGLAVYRIAQI
jgi:glucokinase